MKATARFAIRGSDATPRGLGTQRSHSRTVPLLSPAALAAPGGDRDRRCTGNVLRRSRVTTLAVFCLATGLCAPTGTCLAQNTAPVAHPPRVALLDFTTDDNSYRNRKAAVDFTSALQAELSSDTAAEWVERGQLQLAEKELGLTAMGLSDGDSSVRAGKWAKADMLVMGRFGRSDKGLRTLNVEVLDLACADLLAERSLDLNVRTNQLIKEVFAELKPVAASVTDCLREAKARWERGRDQVKLAVLFLKPSATMPGFPDFETPFLQALDAAAKTNARVRLIRLPRAQRATEEVEMALTGFVESDSEAWKKVTDVYVWGSYTGFMGSEFQRETRTSKRVPQVKCRLNFWGGTGDPRIMEEAFPPGKEFSELGALLAETILGATRARRDAAAPEAARRTISDSLLKQAQEYRRSPSFRVLFWSSPEGRKAVGELLQLFEMACFFDPQDQAAQQELVSFRWNFEFANITANEFRFRWRAGEAWGHHVQRFGLDTIGDAGKAEPAETGDRTVSRFVAANYLLWPARLLELLNLGNKEDYGVPRDISGQTVGEWQQFWSAELARRAKLVAERPEIVPFARQILVTTVTTPTAPQYVPNPAHRRQIVEAIWPAFIKNIQRTGDARFSDRLREGIAVTYNQVGQPGGETKLFAQIPKDLKPPPAPAATTPSRRILDRAPQPSPTPGPSRRLMPDGRPVPLDLPHSPARPEASSPGLPGPAARAARRASQLPRASSIDATRRVLLFDLPALDVFPPLLNPPLRVIEFPREYEAGGVQALIFHDGKVWISATGTEGANVQEENPDLTTELARLKVQALRLWCYEPQTKTLARVAPLATNAALALHREGQRLWLAGPEFGVAALDTRTLKLDHLGTNEALSATAVHAMTRAGGRLVVSAGGLDIRAYDAEAQRWAPFEIDKLGITSWLGGELRRIAGCDQWLMLYSGPVLLYDTQARRSSRWEEALFVESPLAQKGRVNCMAADATCGFWLGSDSGLNLLDPTTGAVRNWHFAPGVVVENPFFARLGTLDEPLRAPDVSGAEKRAAEAIEKLARLRAAHRELSAKQNKPINLVEPTSRLPAAVTALCVDGDFLWVASGNLKENHVLTYHVPSESWVGRFKAPGLVSSLAVSEKHLWIGLQGFYGTRDPLVELEKAAVLAQPKDQWGTDKISADELSRQLNTLSPRQQAFYAFFRGDYAKAAQLLSVNDPGSADLETLWLLAHCYDGLGLNQPDRARRYLEALADLEGDSPFGKEAVLALKRLN